MTLNPATADSRATKPRQRSDVAGLGRRLVMRLQALGLALLWSVLGLLRPEHASALGRALLRRIGPHLRRHQHVRRNLDFVLPDRSAAEREAVAREVWGNFGAVLGEFPHLERIRNEAAERLEIVVEGEIPAFARPPELARPVVFVSAHVGNWELTTVAINLLGAPLSVVYAAPENRWVERLLLRRRRALRCELVPRLGGVRALLRALDAGRSIGLVADTRQDDGDPVTLFGVAAPTTTVPARLALQRGCALVPVNVERTGPVRFRVRIGPPIAADPAITDRRRQALDMTRRIHERFEGWIRPRPDQWWCIRRRWPRNAAPLAPPPLLAKDPAP
ncbi:MAG TPA: lauroyl acyltransferase [Myxococcota bacterium]|jgi:KDO2-lipid IV(A) lauroyltransferase|nr:lauroyl acyltransferase [Myxococcota bacterium]